MNSDYIVKELDLLFPNAECELIYNKDYELLLAVMLSAQTTDKRVNLVTKEPIPNKAFYKTYNIAKKYPSIPFPRCICGSR